MIEDTVKPLLKAARLLDPAYRITNHFFPGLTRWVWRRAGVQHGVQVSFFADHIAVRKGQEVIRLAPQHAVYLGDLFRYFDHYFHAVVPTVAASGQHVVDFSQPATHTLRQSGVQFEFPSLPEADESTKAYLQHLRLQPGQVVLDLGAYAGSGAYFFAQAVGSRGLVAAFEPDRENFKCLQRNLATHALTNVRAFPKGVWRSTTTLAFQTEGNLGSSVGSLATRRSSLQPVEVVTLADALTLAGAETVQAIKMDIEGAELEVIKSAGDFLQRHRPRLVIEPHIVGSGMCTDALRAVLNGWGFKTKLATQGSLTDWPLVVAEPASAG